MPRNENITIQTDQRTALLLAACATAAATLAGQDSEQMALSVSMMQNIGLSERVLFELGEKIAHAINITEGKQNCVVHIKTSYAPDRCQSH